MRNSNERERERVGLEDSLEREAKAQGKREGGERTQRLERAVGLG